jgi:hypothetical protein
LLKAVAIEISECLRDLSMTFAARCHSAPKPIVAVWKREAALAYFPLAALVCSPLVAWGEERSLSLVPGP